VPLIRFSFLFLLMLQQTKSSRLRTRSRNRNKRAKRGSECDLAMTASRLGLADSWGSIHLIRFNQDNSAFVVSLDSGLRVFNVDPLRELSHYNEEKVNKPDQLEGTCVARVRCLVRRETNIITYIST
jgi:hypothetical protein